MAWRGKAWRGEARTYKMECIILYRNTNSDKVLALTTGDEDDIAVFPDQDAAVACADQHPMCCVFPYQIVELVEL